ncbi:MAG TPA: SDR family oxidoreductase [Thermomicrobiales bacterium]|nr:SDR family oxidoreductase [Thermomicrobiales bacterium]
MIRLKPLRDQVVVILGASSGIGRATARQCAARGATVVVAARSEPGLVSLVAEIEAAGGRASHVVCDVTDFDQVVNVAGVAVARYGRIDTWVNAAAVGVYATFEDTSLAEFRRVMDVNLMGYVHGAKAALPHLRREGRGALIFISSIESTVAMPLQGAYATSKHAIQGMVETLRRELRAERVPVSVTSIKPAVINTPFFDNALSKVGYAPTAPPPAYHPAVVAACVCHAAEHPVRDLYPGGAGRVMTVLQLFAPRFLDAAIGRVGIPLQRTDEPDGRGALYEPRVEDDRVEGRISFHTFRLSPYTWLQTHPRGKALGAVVAGVIGGALARRRFG